MRSLLTTRLPRPLPIIGVLLTALTFGSCAHTGVDGGSNIIRIGPKDSS